MPHDDSKTCERLFGDLGRNYLMAPLFVSLNKTVPWSPCSAHSVTEFFDNGHGKSSLWFLLRFVCFAFHTPFWSEGWADTDTDTAEHMAAKRQNRGRQTLSPVSARTERLQQGNNPFQTRTMNIQHQHVDTSGFNCWAGFTENYLVPQLDSVSSTCYAENSGIVFARAEGTRHQTLNFPLSHLVGFLSVPFLGQRRQLLSAKHSVFLYHLKKCLREKKKWEKKSHVPAKDDSKQLMSLTNPDGKGMNVIKNNCRAENNLIKSLVWDIWVQLRIWTSAKSKWLSIVLMASTWISLQCCHATHGELKGARSTFYWGTRCISDSAISFLLCVCVCLNASAGDCLLDVPESSIALPRELPGIKYSLDEQCQQIFGEEFAHCPNASVSSDACSQLWCQEDGTSQCSTKNGSLPWADGTPCSANGTCLHGECVSTEEVMQPPVRRTKYLLGTQKYTI